MSLVMATDIRQPIGWLFTALGVILVGYGLTTGGNPMYERSEGVNINLWWGVIILVFGLLLLLLAWRGRRRILGLTARGTPTPAEEARERATGLPPRGA
jgi:protein-S-isoprenylcysteine O-methyltransferase Ste14